MNAANNQKLENPIDSKVRHSQQIAGKQPPLTQLRPLEIETEKEITNWQALIPSVKIF